MAALFAGLVPANQPAGSPLEIQPVSGATVFLSHNNQPVSVKILPAERHLCETQTSITVKYLLDKLMSIISANICTFVPNSMLT